MWGAVMKTVAIIPAYNEEARIEAAVRDAARFVDAVVVVDDCSRDRTFGRAFAAGAYVLRHILNRGQGASLQTGTDYAIEKLENILLKLHLLHGKNLYPKKHITSTGNG